MKQFVIEGKEISVYPSAAPDKPVVYLNTFAKEGDSVYRVLQEDSCLDFTLVAVSGLDWNHDMAPWDIPPISKDGMPCTGGADEYLKLFTEEIMPKAEREIPGTVLWRGLAGYSLAGLFAVYALYRSDLFSRTASISGSLWFPGFREYMFSHEMKRRPDCLYFSLGSRECRTGNPYLKTVQKNTEEIEAFCRSKGIDTHLKINPGNHYKDAVMRTAAGLGWLLGR